MVADKEHLSGGWMKEDLYMLNVYLAWAEPT